MTPRLKILMNPKPGTSRASRPVSGIYAAPRIVSEGGGRGDMKKERRAAVSPSLFD